MKKGVILLIAMLPLVGQQLSFGPVTSGEMTVSVPVKLASPSGSIAGVQFSIAVPTGVTVTAAPNAALTAKSQKCNVAASVMTCVVYGGSSAIPDGDIATVTVTSTTSQSVSLALSQTIAASPAGDGINPTNGPSISALIKSKCDIDGNGAINTVDINAAASQATKETACGSADITGDGKCDVVDIQRIINAAATGGTCRVGP